MAGWQIALAAILAAHPGMRGVLFDLPHVIADAPKGSRRTWRR